MIKIQNRFALHAFIILTLIAVATVFLRKGSPEKMAPVPTIQLGVETQKPIQTAAVETQKGMVVSTQSVKNKLDREQLAQKWTRLESLQTLVLPTQAALAQKRALLEDPQLIQDSIDSLLVQESESVNDEQTRKRLQSISFINDALAYPDNSKRSFILGEMEKVINQDLPLTGASVNDIQHWAGDRIELYMMLWHYDLDRAVELSKQMVQPAQKEMLRLSLAEMNDRTQWNIRRSKK